MDTSGTISAQKIKFADRQTLPSNVGYVGSQPSVVRQALERLPPMGRPVFADLGCGKGRVCVIATEYAFSRIIGVEFGVKLAKVAARNARLIRRRFPSRPAIDIQIGDATCFTPDGEEPLVLFLYNPFGWDLIKALLAHLETMVGSTRRKIFVIYYNPVHFAAFDASTAFERYDAARLDVTPEDHAAALFGNGYDSVIIYQSRGAPMFEALPGASRKAVLKIPNFAVEVEA